MSCEKVNLIRLVTPDLVSLAAVPRGDRITAVAAERPTVS